MGPQESKRAAFQHGQRQRFANGVFEAGWFEHLILDRPAGTHEADPAVRMFASQLFRDGDARGEMSAGAASSKEVQRRLSVRVIAQ